MNPIKKPEIKYTKLFINNEFVDSLNGKTYNTLNPATLEEIAVVQEGDASDIDRAVRAAKLAFERESQWRRLDASERGKLIYKLADLMERDANYLASLESYNCGKTIVGSYGDVMFSVAILKFYAGAADKECGKLIPADGNKLSYTFHEPIGVCGAIIPWNYPIEMAIIKLAPCLAMGNTLVLKPAEQTPLTALAIASLVKEAGFPAGVFNVVTGFGPCVGQPLAQHPLVSKISFTGSTSVGKLIQRESANTTKRVALELGGKSPLIIFPDADLNKAIQVAHDMIMVNQGQCCVAASRTFVHEDIYDEFVKRSVELARNRRIGDPLDVQTEHGPQIDEKQFAKIISLIKIGQEEGAKLEYGGKRHGNTGYFIEPTVFSNVTDNMIIAREEIFGPVQLLIKFKDVNEVIKRANDSKYGLGAGLFTKDLERALFVSSRLDAGQVYINNYYNTTAQLPFGGFKESGVDREYGLDGLRQYCEIKTVVVDVPFKV